MNDTDEYSGLTWALDADIMEAQDLIDFFDRLTLYPSQSVPYNTRLIGG